MLVDETVLVVNVPTAVALTNALVAGSVVALPATPKPPRGLSCNDGAVPISFCRADALLAGRRATSLQSTLWMLSVFAATFPSVVAARAGGGISSWGRRVSGGGGWHRQCAWDGDGRLVGAILCNSGRLQGHFTRTIRCYHCCRVSLCWLASLFLLHLLLPLWFVAAVRCCSQRVEVVLAFSMLDRCRTGR